MAMSHENFSACHFCKKPIQTEDLVAETGSAHVSCYDEAFLTRFRKNLKEDALRQEAGKPTSPLLSPPSM